MSAIVKCCLNGARELAEHPALPASAEAAGVEAAAAVRAGAAAIHVHPRGHDGRDTLAAESVAEWVAAIRAATRGTPVGVTSGAWIDPDADARVQAICAWRDPLPDFVSVNLGEDGAGAIARACLSRGIGIEAGLWSAQDVERLAASGLEGRWLRLLVEAVCEAPAQLGRVEEIDAALDRLGESAPRLYHGVGDGTWEVLRAARARGRDVRVGLEDVLTLPDGSPAASNADLVRAVATLAARTQM